MSTSKSRGRGQPAKKLVQSADECHDSERAPRNDKCHRPGEDRPVCRRRPPRLTARLQQCQVAPMRPESEVEDVADEWNCAEGSVAPAGDNNTEAAMRADDGCADSNKNSANFLWQAAAPRNLASTAKTCSCP